MFYRSVVIVSMAVGALLVLALGALVTISWLSLQRLEPLQEHLTSFIDLRSTSHRVALILKDTSPGEAVALNRALTELDTRLHMLAGSHDYLSPRTHQRMQAVDQRLTTDVIVNREDVKEALLSLRKSIESEVEAYRSLVDQLSQDAELLWRVSAAFAITLALLSLAIYVVVRARILRPLDDLGYLLGLIARQDYTSALTARVEPVLKPIFEKYNLMVERLMEAEKRHNSREQSLEHEVTDATKALLQQQSALSRAQHVAATGEVTASLAHELRNPLSGVQMTLTNLRRDLEADADATERLDMAVDELKRITNLLNDMLNTSRRAPEPLKRLRLTQSIQTLLALTRYQLPDNIELRAELPDDLECTIPENGLRQALLNLILNASQAMGDKGGEIVLSGALDDSALTLSVCDDGPGFPASVLEQGVRAFDSRRAGGTGLGLATVRRFIKDLDGQLQLYNRERGGACVNLILSASRCESCQNHY